MVVFHHFYYHFNCRSHLDLVVCFWSSRCKLIFFNILIINSYYIYLLFTLFVASHVFFYACFVNILTANQINRTSCSSAVVPFILIPRPPMSLLLTGIKFLMVTSHARINKSVCDNTRVKLVVIGINLLICVITIVTWQAN